MALGRFRDDPAEMSAAEREVVAAQYPEGALVAGMGAGMLGALAFAPALVPVVPIGTGIAGFAVGRWFRRRRIERVVADRGGDDRMDEDGRPDGTRDEERRVEEAPGRMPE